MAGAWRKTNEEVLMQARMLGRIIHNVTVSVKCLLKNIYTSLVILQSLYLWLINLQYIPTHIHMFICDK
jgi:hypothetical protein